MEIGKETLSDTDLFSVVAVEWLVDDDLVISDVPEQTFEDVEAACIISRGECVIFVNDLLDSIKFIQQLPSVVRPRMPSPSITHASFLLTYLSAMSSLSSSSVDAPALDSASFMILSSLE